MGVKSVPSGEGITRLAAADLSSSQFTFVKLASDTTVSAAGATEGTIGVLQNKPESGISAEVKVLGFSLLYVNGNSVNIAAMDFLKPDASSYGVKADTDKDVYGAMALVAATTDAAVIPVLLVKGTMSLA